MSKRPFAPYSERYGTAAPVCWLIDTLWDDYNEHRPRAFQTPTPASGAALPPEGTSAERDHRAHTTVRMAGNGGTDNVVNIEQARKP